MRRLTIFFIDADAASMLSSVPHLLEGAVDLERPAQGADADADVRRYRGVSVVVSDAGARRIREIAASLAGRVVLGPAEPVDLEDIEELLNRRGVAALSAAERLSRPAGQRPTWQGLALLGSTP